MLKNIFVLSAAIVNFGFLNQASALTYSACANTARQALMSAVETEENRKYPVIEEIQKVEAFVGEDPSTLSFRKLNVATIQYSIWTYNEKLGHAQWAVIARTYEHQIYEKSTVACVVEDPKPVLLYFSGVAAHDATDKKGSHLEIEP